MKRVLYRPSWQKLRVSFLSANHPQGGFNTLVGTQDNLNRLNNYINDAQGAGAPYAQEEALRMGFTIEEEFACRVWRALNLLNATRMGYSGQGKKGSEMDRAVEAYRNQIQEFYTGNMVVRAEQKWNWDVVRMELETLWREERYWFEKIYDDLARRRKVATKRRVQRGGAQVDATRPELLTFVTMLEEVNRV